MYFVRHECQKVYKKIYHYTLSLHFFKYKIIKNIHHIPSYQPTYHHRYHCHHYNHPLYNPYSKINVNWCHHTSCKQLMVVRLPNIIRLLNCAFEWPKWILWHQETSKEKWHVYHLTYTSLSTSWEKQFTQAKNMTHGQHTNNMDM